MVGNNLFLKWSQCPEACSGVSILFIGFHWALMSRSSPLEIVPPRCPEQTHQLP